MWLKASHPCLFLLSGAPASPMTHFPVPTLHGLHNSKAPTSYAENPPVPPQNSSLLGASSFPRVDFYGPRSSDAFDEALVNWYFRRQKMID